MDNFQPTIGSAMLQDLEYFKMITGNSQNIFYQLLPEDLVRQAVEMGEGVLSSTGSLVIDTGEFNGRSPKDRFIVKDDITEKTIDWNGFNQPKAYEYFDLLLKKMLEYIKGKKIWIRDSYVCANTDFRLNVRVINENPCCNLFAYNLFLRSQK